MCERAVGLSFVCLSCVFLSHSGFLSDEWLIGKGQGALLLPLGVHNAYRTNSAAWLLDLSLSE